MWWVRSRPVVFFLLFLIGMTNHESIVFLAPWFVLVTRESYGTRTRWLTGSVLGLAAVVGAYLIFRSLLAGASGGELSAYLVPLRDDPLHWVRRSSPWQGVGLFSVFELAWVFAVAAVVSLWRQRRWREILEILLQILCAGVQFFLAFDSSRLFTLGFMSMVLSLRYLFNENPFSFRRWAVPVFVLNLAVPAIFTAADQVVVLVPTLVRVFQRL
jgi:hypothetical protein